MRRPTIRLISQAQLSRAVLFVGCGLVLFYLVAPVFAIIPLSFNPEPFFSYNFNKLSMRWYEQLLASGEWRLAFTNSVIVASSVVVLATLLGTLAALGITLSDFPLKGAIVGLLVSPLMVPHIIIGVGAFFFYTWIGIANTLFGLILVHTALAAPFVVLTVTATLANFNRNLLRAGQSLGAGPIVVFREIMLPLIWPGILSGAVFAFIASFDELIVAIMLAGSENRTLPRQMWSGVREEISPVITAVATILVTLALLVLATMELLRRRAERLGLPGTTGAPGGA